MVWPIVYISVVFSNVYCAVLPDPPCTFPTCELPPTHCRVVRNAKGCPTCNFVCRYGSRVCPETWCANSCANGYAMDRSGCQTCYCKDSRYQPPPAPPPPVGCQMMCPTGLCPYSCACQPNCYSSGPKARRFSEPEEPNEMNGGK